MASSGYEVVRLPPSLVASLGSHLFAAALMFSLSWLLLAMFTADESGHLRRHADNLRNESQEMISGADTEAGRLRAIAHELDTRAEIERYEVRAAQSALAAPDNHDLRRTIARLLAGLFFGWAVVGAVREFRAGTPRHKIIKKRVA